MLMPEGKVVSYESNKLNAHEHKYPTHYLELFAIVHALKAWRHYFIGRKLLLKFLTFILKDEQYFHRSQICYILADPTSIECQAVAGVEWNF